MKDTFYVYFVPKTHHDLGYTHTIDDLFGAYCKYYDDVLDFCDKTSDYPVEAQYRYTVESFWSLEYYLKHTSEKNRERMKKYVKDGRIEIQAFYANVIDGICSEEEIARLMYPSMAYTKECGAKVTSAALTDIPGMSAGLIKALADAGISNLFAGFPTYFEWGDCTGKEIETPNSFWNEKKLFGWGHPVAFNWKALNGGEVFTWYQYGYGYMGKDSEPALEAEVYEEVECNLPGYIARLKAKGVPYSVMRYVDHGLDNVPPAMSVCDVVKKWNEEHEDIKCVVATETMFFEALRKDCHGMELQTIHGELPHTDYTTCALSEAQMTAFNARTKAKMEMLEKFNTIALMHGCGQNITEPMSSMYSDVMLYDEHCFGMATFGYKNDYNRSFKLSYAFGAAKKAEALEDIMKSQIVAKDEGVYTLFCGAGVKGKSISSIVQCEKQETEKREGAYILTDSKGNEIYVQCDMIKDVSLPIEGLTDKYALKAPNEIMWQYTAAVPEKDCISLSEIHPAGTYHVPDEVKCSDSVFENKYYRIEFDTEKGGVKSVFDKEIAKYVTDDVYQVGGILVRNIETNQMYQPKIEYMYHRMSGAVADSMVIHASVYSIPLIVAEITLYHTMKRIDFAYRLILDRTPFREAFVVFPFKTEAPIFTYQGIGTPVRAFDDIVEGANTNQYTCQHWCKAEGKEYACVLAMSEARVTEFGGIHTTAVSQAHRHLSPSGFAEPYITKEDINHAHIASMILYNNCRTNFAPTQQGEVIYRYSMTTGSMVREESFAENFAYPPILMKGKMPEGEITVGSDHLTITCVKEAENGDGYIMRIKETEGRKAKAKLNFASKKAASVIKCTITEQEICEITADDILMDAYETLTAKIRFSE